MLKILKYIKKYWCFALLAPLFMIGEVVMDLFLSQYMEKMIDYGIQTNNMDNIIDYGLIMLAIVILGVLFGILSGVFTNITAFKLSNNLRKDVFNKIMYLSFEESDKLQTGSLVTRVTNDVTQVQNMVSMALRGLIRAFSFFILGIVFTLSISKDFAMILVFILPIEVIVLVIFMKLVFPIFSQIQARLDKVNTIVHENVSGARVVKAFSKEQHENDRFINANNNYTAKTLYVSKISALLMPILTLVIYIGTITIYKIGGDSIFTAFKNNTGEMLMVGEISQAVTYITMICMSIIMLGMMFTNMARAYASAKRINEILNIENIIIEGKEEQGKYLRTIEFKNVDFKYPSAQEDNLKNLSFKIKKGETIAIVGSTGSGKSSLVNLIPRFYDVTNGEIIIDGINIKDYKLKELRQKISLCLQKSELFSGTIKDNITFGCLNATDEEIKRASEIAQASSFIEATENGYDEYVEEKGTSLSGGQKQRICIARAIVRKPEILIFDDSTSALDLVTEAKLYQGLKQNLSDTTIIVVAQRVATAKNADRILVIDNGKIVSFDTHENLLKNCSLYQDIYNSQLKKGGEIYE